jgi:hypothetical protein
MSMPIIPPFAVAASYQNSQYGSGSIFAPSVPSVFKHLVTPPSSGTAAETWSDQQGEADGFTAYSAANEVQTITVNGSPTGGTFFLEWGDATTAGLAFNVSAANLQAALVGLASSPAATGGTNDVQTLTVAGAPTGGTFTATWGGQTTAAIAFNASAAAVQTALAALSNVGAGVAGTYSQQSVQIVGGPTGGTFTLVFGGQTATLAFNASASAVQTALQGLSSIGSGNVTVAGNAGGPYTLTFAGTLTGPQALFTGSTASLTGGAAASSTLVIATTITGAASVPNVKVTGSNGGPWVVTFVGTLGSATQSAITTTSSLTGGTSPSVGVVHTTSGVSKTQNITVTGSNGGPYTVTFANALAGTSVVSIAADGTLLTGGTTPSVTVATTTQGQAAFVNQAKLNATQQFDPQVNFYDKASGNHF